VTEPALVPPLGVTELALAPQNAPPPTEGLVRPTGVEVVEGQCGLALFAEGELLAIAILGSAGLLRSYLGTQSFRRVPHHAADPARGTPLDRTRRAFLQARYARVRERRTWPPYRIVDLSAPRVCGWAALAGTEVLALELRPRVARKAPTVARGAVD